GRAAHWQVGCLHGDAREADRGPGLAGGGGGRQERWLIGEASSPPASLGCLATIESIALAAGVRQAECLGYATRGPALDSGRCRGMLPVFPPGSHANCWRSKFGHASVRFFRMSGARMTTAEVSTPRAGS